MAFPIRILGIAPYEGMQSLMRQAAADYPEIELNAMTGDLQKGLDVAQKNFHANYDVIISRGGTAQLLRERVSLPVVEIPITEYDILRALHLAENISDRFAIIGFPNVTSSAQNLTELLPVAPKLFTIHSSEEAHAAISEAWEQGFRTVLCDVVATTAAYHIGMNAILITSGQESIHKALDNALLLCRSLHNLQAENHFLRQVIDGHSAETVVFDEKQNLYFSTLDDSGSPKVLEMLKSEIGSAAGPEPPSRIVRSLDGLLYTIKKQLFSVEGKQYTTFYFSHSKTPFTANRSGVRYYTQQQAQQVYDTNFYSITDDMAELESVIAQINLSQRPLMLLGESGTGKESVAMLLYIRSSLRNHPLVSINCALLNEKTWEYLQSSHNSPFAQSQMTIFFSQMADLSEEKRSQLLAVLMEMDVARRNRVIFSYKCKTANRIPEHAQAFLEKFCCLTHFLPPLRHQAERIPALINMYLSQLSITQTKEILGMEPAAIRLMQSFPWPRNHEQFKRIMQELVTISKKPFITAASVQSILSLEASSPIAQSELASPERFDLNRSLEEIDREVIRRVLTECDGNQTAAAKRLGISRTTLWRCCKQ